MNVKRNKIKVKNNDKTLFSSFAFIRGRIISYGTTDYLIVKYLKQYFNKVYLIASYEAKYCPKDIDLINIPVRKIPIPLLDSFIVSIIALLKVFSLRPDIILWEWSCSFPGAFICKILYHRAKVIIDIRSHPIMLKNTIASRISEAFFGAIVRSRLFLYFTIITESMLAYIRIRYRGLKNKKVCIWQSGYDYEIFKKVLEFIRNKSNVLDLVKQDLGINDNSIILLYYGSIDLARIDMLVTIIDSIKVITTKGKNVKLLLVGDGNAVQYLQRYVAMRGLQDHVIIHPSIPYIMVPLYLALADVVLAPYPININWYVQHPLKVVEAIGMLKPVVVTPLKEFEEKLPQEFILKITGGRLDPYKLAYKIEEVLSITKRKDEKYSQILEKLKKLREEYSWENIAQKLYKCLRDKLS